MTLPSDDFDRDRAAGWAVPPVGELPGDELALALAVVDAAPDAMVVVDESGRIELINRQVEQLFGYERSQVVGQPVELLVPADRADVHRTHRARFHAAPTVRPMGSGLDLVARRADGSLVPVEVSLSPLDIADRHCVVAAIRDVSERVAAERGAQRVRRAVDSIKDGVYMVDPDTLRFVYVNEGAQRQSGFTAEELLGSMTPLDLSPEFNANNLAELLRPLREGGVDSVQVDTVIRPKTGAEYPVEVVIEFPRVDADADGKRVLVAVVRDITERARAEEQLRRSESRFRATFDDGPVPMAVVSLEGRRIVEANQAMVDITGYPRDRLIGMVATDLVHPDDLDSDDLDSDDLDPDDLDPKEAVAGQRWQSGLLQLGPTLRLVRADGAERWVATHIGPVADHGPNPTLIVHAVDVTPMAEIEAARFRHESLNDAVSAIRLAMLEGASRADGLRLLCRSARDLLDASSALVLAPVGHGDELRIEASVGVAPEVAQRFEFRSTVGVVGEAWETGEVQTTLPTDERVSRVNQQALDGHPVGPIVVAPFGPSAPVGEPSGVLIVAYTDDVPELAETALITINEFASVAMSAIALAQAREAEQALALLEDRERIGRDMHDSVIGRLFATGLSVHAVMEALGDSPQAERLADVVDDLDDAIKEIRTVVFAVRSPRETKRAARARLLDAIEEQVSALGFDPRVDLSGPIDDLPEAIVEQLVLSLREACANAARHAEASEVSVEVSVTSSQVSLVITDDGVGLPEDCSSSTESGIRGRGLANIRARAEQLGGQASFERGETGGTIVRWTVPRTPVSSDRL